MKRKRQFPVYLPIFRDRNGHESPVGPICVNQQSAAHFMRRNFEDTGKLFSGERIEWKHTGRTVCFQVSDDIGIVCSWYAVRINNLFELSQYDEFSGAAVKIKFRKNPRLPNRRSAS